MNTPPLTTDTAPHTSTQPPAAGGLDRLAAFIQQLPPDSSLMLHHASWQQYEQLLEAVGEAKGLRISYDDERLHIMVISFTHENYADFIQDVVRVLSLRLDVEVLSFGSATLKNRMSLKGAEPDACFYVQSAAAIGARTDLNLNTDPPPDFVVEVDLYHESLGKFSIYAALNVPEVWRYDGQSLTIHQLQDGQYVAATTSSALPVLTGEILTRLIEHSQQEGQFKALRSFEAWLQTLQP